MKPRSKPKAKGPSMRNKSSVHAKFAMNRETEVALTRRDPDKIPADRGAREKKSTSQGSE